MSTCEYVSYSWGPHPGCKEFMTEPDSWQCQEEATHIVSGTCDFNPEPPHEPTTEELRLCETHAREMVEQEPDEYWHDAVMVEVQR